MPLSAAQQKQLRANRGLDDSAIVYFGREYEFLSNFLPAPVQVDGVLYKTAEHAFQAQKVATAADRQRVLAAATAGAAKAIGRSSSVPKVPGWFGEGRKEAMRKVLAAKVRVSLRLRALASASTKVLLTATGLGDCVCAALWRRLAHMRARLPVFASVALHSR